MDEEIPKEEVIKIYKEHFDTTNWISDRTTLVALIVVYILMMIVAFFLNIVIFLTVLVSKNLHKPNILLSLNLIIANLLSTTVCTPFTMNSIIFEFWKFEFNDLLCKSIPFIQATTVFAISTTVTIISIDRYMMITSLKNNNYRLLRPFNDFSKRKLLVNLVIWGLAFVLSSPVLIYQKLIQIGIEGLYAKKVCIEQYPDSFRLAYTSLTFVYAFIIPLLTLTFFHYKIKIYLNANILKFDISRDKLANIKTISSKSQQSLFMNLNKRNSDTNYYSLIDLNLLNSSDTHSSPTQIRDLSLFNSDVERARLSVRLAPKKRTLNKSLTLSNNFQFNAYLPPPVYRPTKSKSLKNGVLNSGNNSIINKSHTTNTLSTEAIRKIKKTCTSYVSLNQLSANHLSSNHLKLTQINLLTICSNDSSGNESFETSSNSPQLNTIVNQSIEQKPKSNVVDNKSSFEQINPAYTIIYRSLSDSNLLDFNQSGLHNSFLHAINRQTQSNNLKKPNLNQSNQISPTFSAKGLTNLDSDYLKLVNFDYNQRTNAIMNLRAINPSNEARKSEQMKLASFTKIACFLNRRNRFQYLKRELQRNQKITLILVLGIIVFAISWLPLNIFNIYFDFNYANITLPNSTIYIIFSVCHIIAMSSAIWNAILYGLLNTNIQKELIKLFKKCLHSNR